MKFSFLSFLHLGFCIFLWIFSSSIFSGFAFLNSFAYGNISGVFVSWESNISWEIYYEGSFSWHIYERKELNGNVFLASEWGIYKSSDFWRTWHQSIQIISNEVQIEWVQRIQEEVRNTLFWFWRNGLFLSLNGGYIWTKIYSSSVSAFWFGPSISWETIISWEVTISWEAYIWYDDGICGQLYRSSNIGASWELLQPCIIRFNIWNDFLSKTLWIDPIDRWHLFIRWGELYESFDGGETLIAVENFVLESPALHDPYWMQVYANESLYWVIGEKYRTIWKNPQ